MNLNRQYKLENQKFTKEYTQDFLEEYKTPEASANSKQIFNANKIYESDANNTETNERRNSTEGGVGFAVVDNNLTIEDDEEFLFYNNRKRSTLENLCSCLFPFDRASPI